VPVTCVAALLRNIKARKESWSPADTAIGIDEDKP
jgi:hypothetical protein